MVDPPRPGVSYTAVQVAEMRQAYPDFVMPGYALRVERGRFTFVPYREASGGGIREADGSSLPSRGFKMTVAEPFKAPPIVKRTPQQRLSSLTEKWYADCIKTGTIPGLSDDKVRELVGRSWKRGDPFTVEDVRKAAASMLQMAENKYEASERRKVVRTAPSD